MRLADLVTEARGTTIIATRRRCPSADLAEREMIERCPAQRRAISAGAASAYCHPGPLACRPTRSLSALA